MRKEFVGLVQNLAVSRTYSPAIIFAKAFFPSLIGDPVTAFCKPSTNLMNGLSVGSSCDMDRFVMFFDREGAKKLFMGEKEQATCSPSKRPRTTKLTTCFMRAGVDYFSKGESLQKQEDFGSESNDETMTCRHEKRALARSFFRTQSIPCPHLRSQSLPPHCRRLLK